MCTVNDGLTRKMHPNKLGGKPCGSQQHLQTTFHQSDESCNLVQTPLPSLPFLNCGCILLVIHTAAFVNLPPYPPPAPPYPACLQISVM